MIRIATDNLAYTRASKTKSIIARPLGTIIVDQDIACKLLLDTLEGTQEISQSKTDTMVCVGVNNDVWQQDKYKLLQKYDVVDFTKDGWCVCKPKPENEVNSFHVTKAFLESMSEDYLASASDLGFSIVGQWGKESPDGFLQFGVAGDYICQNISDETDVWIVKQFLYRSSYGPVGAALSAEEISMDSRVLPFCKAL